MSWNQKGGGNAGGPWGQPPKSGGTGGSGNSGGGSGGNGGRTPPPNNNDFDDLFKKSQEQLREMFGGSGASDDNKRAGFLLLAVTAVLWLASGIYVVETSEQGIVMRFGKYHTTDMPGLNYHLPWPIETVYTPSVTNVIKEKVGADAAGASYGDRHGESLMLTKDLNIADVNFEVQWKIDSDATGDFLFNVRDAEFIVKPVAESAMREVIGQTPLDALLGKGQAEIANHCKDIIQKTLDDYKAGIQVMAVNLSKPDVPSEVIDAFQDVKRAEQEKNTLINKAESYSNQIIPKARGAAVQFEQNALAYKQQITERATGDVARFISVYEQYKDAKDVTKKRMYLETMEEVLGRMNKYIVDGKGGAGVLPYMAIQGNKGAAQ